MAPLLLFCSFERQQREPRTLITMNSLPHLSRCYWHKLPPSMLILTARLLLNAQIFFLEHTYSIVPYCWLFCTLHLPPGAPFPFLDGVPPWTLKPQSQRTDNDWVIHITHTIAGAEDASVDGVCPVDICNSEDIHFALMPEGTWQ